MKNEIRVGILGASGLTGMQLVTLLDQHPEVEEIALVSRSHTGKSVSQIFPALKGYCDLKFCSPEDEKLNDVNVLFNALPGGVSAEYFDKFISNGSDIIDLSSDYRLASVEEFSSVHRDPPRQPELLKLFEHVIPEINMPAPKPGQNFISAAGCSTTAVLLALWPILQSGNARLERIIADVKTSSSASFGRKSNPQMHFNRKDSVRPYKVLQEHRHCAEASSLVRSLISAEIDLQINCFAVDLSRGLSAAIYVELVTPMTVAALADLYRKSYADRPFVRLFRHPNSPERLPNPKNCSFTNLCDIGFEISKNGKQVVLISCLDNLLKGGAGQAVQIFNLLHGFDEDVGLNMRCQFP